MVLPSERDQNVDQVHYDVGHLAHHANVKSKVISVGCVSARVRVEFILDKIVGSCDKYVPRNQNRDAKQQKYQVDYVVAEISKEENRCKVASKLKTLIFLA